MKNKKVILFAGSALVIGAAVFFITRQRFNKANIEYQEVSVQRGPIKKTILANGVVKPENRLELKPPIAGRVESIPVQEGQKVRKGQILAWLSSTERAALLDTARAKGKEELKYWEDAYKPTPLVAPISGIIILASVKEGQSVTASDPVVVMSDRLSVKAAVDETDIAEIKVGQAVEVVLDAFPDQRMPAKVVHIAYDAKTVNSVTIYEVDVVPTEVPSFMKSGMTANATFVVQEEPDALFVPAAAVKRHDGKQFVLVRDADPEREPVSLEVKAGVTDGKKIEILEGLKENDKILMAVIAPGKKEKRSNAGGSPLNPMGTRRH